MVRRLKDEICLESRFQHGQAAASAAKAAAAADAAQAQQRAAAAAEREAFLAQSHRADSHDRRLVHAWVLVKAGPRDVKADCFVEVTSGRVYGAQSAPYHGIEAAWNHENFWVAVGMPEPHSDSRLHPACAHFRWSDRAMWEPLLHDPLPPAPLAATAAAAHTNAGASSSVHSGTAGHAGNTAHSHTEDAGGHAHGLESYPPAHAALDAAGQAGAGAQGHHSSTHHSSGAHPTGGSQAATGAAHTGRTGHSSTAAASKRTGACTNVSTR